MDTTLMRILDLLNEQGKSQKDLTSFLKISANSFTNWKSGLNTSYKKYIYAIAEYFNVSVDYLLGNSDERKKETANNDSLDNELIRLLADLTPSEAVAVKSFLAGLKANRKE